jgi:hypothetical protein
MWETFGSTEDFYNLIRVTTLRMCGFLRNYFISNPCSISYVRSSLKQALRKQARQLENEIDSKLVSYSKLCSNYTSTALLANTASSASSVSPSASNTSSDLLFATLSNELEEALKKLTTVNSRMTEALNSETGVNSNATVHTLQVNIFTRIILQYNSK